MAMSASGRARSRGNSRNSQVHIRPLNKDSTLLLCGYRPKCTKGDRCIRAHSEQELESWRFQLLETVRRYRCDHHRLSFCRSIEGTGNCRKVLDCEYAHSQKELDHWAEAQETLKAELSRAMRDYIPDHHQLKLCTSLKRDSHSCKNGLECMFAHSQKELDAWREQLGCLDGRRSENKLLEMCRNAAKVCRYKEECRYAHTERELQRWKEEHRQKYLQSEASIPERCTYTAPTPTCQLGTSCPYAHTNEEREELIRQLISYDKTKPRPVPRRDKLLPYTLCENHRNERRSFEGECIYGRQCKQPHSKWELASWEAERETGNLVAVRLYDVSECKLKLCKDVTWGMGRGVARGVPITGHCCGGERCRYAHSKEELEEWIRKSRSMMLGTPVSPNESDPFLTSLVDYQRRFSDELATVLNTVVMMATQDKNISKKLGAFINHNRLKVDLTSKEGQGSASLRDIQYLLGYLQRNSASLAGYFGVERDYLMGVISDLMEIRNILAHGLYQKEREGEVSDKTEKFIQRGVEFVQRILRSQEAMRNGYTLDSNSDEVCEYEDTDESDDDDENFDAIKRGYDTLIELQDTFRDFLSYQRENTKRVKSYSQLSTDGKKAAALETLQVIQELLEEEREPGTVTTFLATSLRARFRNKT